MEKEIGKVTHYFNNIGVAIIELSDDLRLNDEIRIKGGIKDFTEEVTSMEIDREKVEEAHAGDAVGIKLNDAVREGYRVYKAIRE